MSSKIGKPRPTDSQKQTWVQTERRSHEAWSLLIKKSPIAARLVHVLVANMDGKNAVVASQSTLGELMSGKGQKPVHRNSVRNAIKVLEKNCWIEVVKIGGKGGALAYIVNDRVAWGRPRGELRYSRFSAQVLASSSEQTDSLDDRPELRQIPTLARGEQQLPSGPHDDPPSQPSLDGMEPSLPEIHQDPDGTEWEVDPETGEAQRLMTGSSTPSE